MHRALTVTAIALGVLAAPTLADAKTTRPAPPKPAVAAADASYHVNHYDPAGNYRGYPDWARRALSGRQSGGGR